MSAARTKRSRRVEQPVSAEISRAGRRIGREPSSEAAEDDVWVAGADEVAEFVRELSPSADPFRAIPDVGACLHDVRALAHLAAMGGKTEAEILKNAIHAAVAELELVADRVVNTPEEIVLHQIADRLSHVAEFAHVASKILEAERAEAAARPRRAVVSR